MSLPIDQKGARENGEIPSVGTEMFTLKYALTQYEPLSITGRAYEQSIRRQIQLVGGIRDDDVVIDYAGGSGNSAFEIAMANRNFGVIHVVDPSGMIDLARRKFWKISDQAWAVMTDNISIPDLTRDRIEEQRVATRDIMDKVHFHRVSTENAGFALGELLADKAFIVQGFHWMSFSPTDIDGNNVDYARSALGVIRSHLKKGGLFSFDESGLQFRYEDTEEGRRLNGAHLTNHAFHRAFVSELNALLAELGLQGLNPEKLDRYHNMFDIDTIKNLLEQSGFELVPTPEGKPYAVTEMPKSREQVTRFIRDGGPMRCFGRPELQALPNDVKLSLVDRALESALAIHGDLLDNPDYPIAETLAFFVAKAV